MEESFWRNSFGDRAVASEPWEVASENWKRDLL